MEEEIYQFCEFCEKSFVEEDLVIHCNDCAELCHEKCGGCNCGGCHGST